ncbi:MAG: mannose-1-phosphate guanylyltransferase/mannose-6-phosphate isomerase [Ramlibacter sp.]
MNQVHIVPIVLAGGSGTRLWPLSRQLYPKQFLSFADKHTLLQQAVLRLEGLRIPEADTRPGCTVGNEEHRFLLRDQLREIRQSGWKILLEPAGRNTAPALTLAALHAVDETGGDPILVATPADHAIGDADAFASALHGAILAAADGSIVLVGIRPSRPETGFGYIRCEGGGPVHRVGSFEEKPDFATAEKFLAHGGYFWNGGIFVVRASVWLRALATFRPDIADASRAAWAARTTDDGFVRPDKDLFAAIPSESVDYAVIEKCPAQPSAGFALKMVALESDWSDLGAWDAVWQIGGKDPQGNVAHGDVAMEDSRDSLVYATSRLVSTIGLDHIVIVETPDAVLVADRAHTQDVKRIVQQLGDQGREEGNVPRLVHRPWGWYDRIDGGPRFQVKRIMVAPKRSLSLQMHHHRAEHWIVVSGTAEVTCGDTTMLLTENQSTYIPLGQVHRLSNPGAIPLEIIEVQSGSYLGEDDIVRLQDSYGRH